LNEPSIAKPELVSPAASTLAYATAVQPIERPEAISTDSFNDRFGSFDTSVRSGNLPPLKKAPKAKQVASVAPASKAVAAVESAVSAPAPEKVNRFAAFDAVAPSPALSLKDLGLGETSRALALRKSLGIPETTKLGANPSSGTSGEANRFNS